MQINSPEMKKAVQYTVDVEKKIEELAEWIVNNEVVGMFPDENLGVYLIRAVEHARKTKEA